MKESRLRNISSCGFRLFATKIIWWNTLMVAFLLVMNAPRFCKIIQLLLHRRNCPMQNDSVYRESTCWVRTSIRKSFESLGENLGRRIKLERCSARETLAICERQWRRFFFDT